MTSVDYRAAVSAREGSHGSAPTAAVTITSYTRSGGRWILARNQRLPGTYFWKTVTAKGALCRLELSTAGPAPPRVIIRLLLSPALGCGRTHTVALSPA